MNRLTARLAIVLAALLSTLTVQAEPNIAKFDTGKYVMGPQFKGKDLQGKIIVVEYWGITCPPCIRAIPHTTELAKKYGHDKLAIIANQVWGASDGQVKQVWQKHAKTNHVMVVNRGTLPGFNPRGVPSAAMFDHTGKFIWQGHPGSMDQPLAAAIAKLPDKPVQAEPDASEEAIGPAPIVQGIEPKFFKREVQQINDQNRSIISSLTKLRRAVDRASDPAQTDEAKTILASVESWAKDLEAKAVAALAKDPATAYAIADQAYTLLGRDELGAEFVRIKKQVESDKAGLKEIQSTLMLRKAVALSKALGLSEDSAADSETVKSKDGRRLGRELRILLNAYPDTEAGKKAEKLIRRWGLEG